MSEDEKKITDEDIIGMADAPEAPAPAQEERNTEQLGDQVERDIPKPIDESKLADLKDDEYIGDYLITKGQLLAWKDKYPHSRFIYFEYFDVPYVIRSYTWGDFEEYNNKLSGLLREAQEKKKAELLKDNPNMKPEEIGQILDRMFVQPRIQNYHFLQMVVCTPEDIPERLMRKEIDAGLPAAIIDLAHRSSGFGEIQADIL